MEGVEIIDLDLVKQDDRGIIFQFQNRATDNVLLIKRKQWTISGRHYHTWANKMKDPETLVFLEGEFEMILKNIKTEETYIETFHRPVMFKISPFIYHEIKAITDIIMLDMNGIDADDDTIKIGRE